MSSLLGQSGADPRSDPGTLVLRSSFFCRLLLLVIVAAADMCPDVTRAATPGAMSTAASRTSSASPAERFDAENRATMTRMMAEMSVKATGNVSRDFVAMMVPHHQAAIDMAESELRYSRNEQLMRIAQQIIVEQLQEIGAMGTAVGERVSPDGSLLAAHASKAEVQFMTESQTARDQMMKEMALTPSGDVDRDFVAMMVPHHLGAIDMAKAALRHGMDEDSRLRVIAQEIIVDQRQEITLMRLAVGGRLPLSVPGRSMRSPSPTVSDELP